MLKKTGLFCLIIIHFFLLPIKNQLAFSPEEIQEIRLAMHALRPAQHDACDGELSPEALKAFDIIDHQLLVILEQERPLLTKIEAALDDFKQLENVNFKQLSLEKLVHQYLYFKRTCKKHSISMHDIMHLMSLLDTIVAHLETTKKCFETSFDRKRDDEFDEQIILAQFHTTICEILEKLKPYQTQLAPCKEFLQKINLRRLQHRSPRRSPQQLRSRTRRKLPSLSKRAKKIKMSKRKKVMRPKKGVRKKAIIRRRVKKRKF